MAQGPLLSAAGMVRENIVYDKDGQAYIPASQRPDGTWRKARRVKEGYIPPDEIPVYQSKGRQLQLARETPQLSTGLNHMDEEKFFHSAEDTQFADTADKPLTRAQKKNARKKQKKRDKKSTELAFEIEEITTGFEDMSLTEKEKTMPTEGSSVTTEVAASVANTLPDAIHEDEERERLKRERALRKKLKQIRDLESRITSGEITKPDRDQQAKIAKKAEIEAELQLLELDSS